MATIVITTDNLAPEGMDLIRRNVERVVTMPLNTPADRLLSIIEQEKPVGIVSRSLRLDARMIAAAPDLKVISKYGVGFDNIDIAAATANGVPVYITRGANSQSVAELALGLMIAVARRILIYDRRLRSGLWQRTLSEGVELNGSVLGIVGYGMIGRRVAAIAAAFGMKVLVYDPLLSDEAVPEPFVKYRDLQEMLPECDVLSLHCPLNGTTRKMIGAPELELLKRTAILINTARGAVVDEHALVELLKENRILGAGLDTFAVEPLSSSSELLVLENVVLTPHCGAGTAAAARRVSLSVANNLLEALAGKTPPLENLVNPEVFEKREPWAAGQ